MSPRNPTGVLVKVVITTIGLRHPKVDVDGGLYFDVSRTLRNPADDPAMRQLTGLHPAVRDHVLGTPGAMRLVEEIAESAKTLLLSYKDKRRRIVHVTIACAGGRHRSVALAEAAADYLRGDGIGVEVDHRHIDLPVIQDR
jgi:UPF0042 nucleotide-binding protein